MRKCAGAICLESRFSLLLEYRRLKIVELLDGTMLAFSITQGTGISQDHERSKNLESVRQRCAGGLFSPLRNLRCSKYAVYVAICVEREGRKLKLAGY